MPIEIEEIGENTVSTATYHAVKFIGENTVGTAKYHAERFAGVSDISGDELGILFKNGIPSSPMSPDTIRSSALAKSEDTLSALERVILKWDVKTESKMLLKSGPQEVSNYIDTIENLHQLMKQFSAHGRVSPDMNRAQRLMEISMARLQKEFHEVLSSYSEALDPDPWSFYSSTEDSISSSSRSSSSSSSTDRTYEFQMVPLGAMGNLRSIAQLMARTGYARECVRVFALTRKYVVEGSLYNLGVEKVRLNDIRKMKWEFLDEKIRKWIWAAKISIRVLFAREKRLCDAVFEGLVNMRDYCYIEIAQEPTARLFAFVEAVSATSREPERLFRVLDLYETLTDLMPDVEATYCQELCTSVNEQADTILARLGEVASGMLTEFEKAIEKEKSKAPIAGGTVHPLTRYVMNYLAFLCDYRETLVNITADAPGELRFALPDDFSVDDDVGAPAPLSIRLGWTVFLLVCKLETKSGLYKDGALSYMFLVNNIYYIVQKVKGSKLKYILGEEWLRKQCDKVRQYAESYEKAAWTKVLSFLTDDEIPSGGNYGGGVRYGEELKERLKGFNLAIEEARKRHSGWVVADVSLREKLRNSVSEKLIPAYTSFLARFRSRFESDMNIKYTPEEMQDLLLEIFKGNLTSINKMRSW
ncbi:hypothetical protein SUGI_0030480 [Cryptomeria japonica]|uniref:exocyst complex component EXO70A1-like n=1 Tax=Cryptomeria japonica TaxID=3369 RepID=UPI0024089CFD|nr:exocyst complex component EXO70A1-like [Cryptomeria japonica]GLJ06027.1 hypothetical protein SUGI_0030480 [Cryptomeria japonica]